MPQNLPDLITLALATYYLAITLTKLHGPGALAERIRHAVYRRRGFQLLDLGSGVGLAPEWLRPAGGHGADARTERLSDDWVATGAGCPLCASLYAAALLVATSALLPGATPMIQVLAVAGAASVLFSLGRYW